MSGERVSITNEEVAAFSAKLQDWAKDLPPKERALLDVLVKLASASMPGGAELSDEQLASVAGGVGTQTAAILGSIVTPGKLMDDPGHEDDIKGIVRGLNKL
jgi:hypothetical protein